MDGYCRDAGSGYSRRHPDAGRGCSVRAYLAMVGEYRGRPATRKYGPLDKLRGLLAEPAGQIDFSRVEFKIRGRELVGIPSKENNLTKRS